jgi:hypothetical protein
MPNCWHGKLLHVHAPRASLLLLSLLSLLLRLQVSLLMLLLLLEALVVVGVMWHM